MRERLQNFGVQSARFSLYAPFTAMVIGLFTQASKSLGQAAMIIVGINILLIVAGFVLGIVALISMRRFGRTGILGRAIAGLIFNGLILAALATLVLPEISFGRTRQRVVGRWLIQTQASGYDKMELTFNNDGSFVYDASLGGQSVVALDGQWTLTRSRIIGVTVDHVTVGNPSVAGTRMGLGVIQSVDESRLVLHADHGDETYARE